MNEALFRLGLVDEEEIILDEAALSLALLDHPDASLTDYEEMIEAMAIRLDAVGFAANSARERADALSRVIGEEFRFVGDSDTYDDPANADLIRVLDRRRGLPVSLSILYVAAARRLGWSANVLDVPGHVLVLIGQDVSPVIVDPFRGGLMVHRDQLVAMVSGTASGTSVVRHVATMSNRAVLVRLLLNQATRAEEAGGNRRALELYGRMTVMAPGFSNGWWERARLELIEGDVPAARKSLTALLEVSRKPALRRSVISALGALGTS